MELIIDLKENDYDEMEGKAYFELMNRYIDLTYDKKIPFEYVAENVRILNKLTKQVLEKLCYYSKIYCIEHIKEYPDIKVDIDIEELKKDLDILKYMEIEEIVVNYNDMSTKQRINLSGSCCWDEETGIQWIIEENKVIYTGPWEDLNAWNESNKDLICNYVKDKK